MLSHTVPQRLYYFALYLTAFVIPFPFVFAPIAIIILSVTWVINFNGRNVLVRLNERKALWLWILYYLLHIVSYFYSSDKLTGGNDLESKLSFVILPVIVGTGLVLNNVQMEKIFSSYISGVFIVAIYFLSRATYTWSVSSDTSVFFYHNLIKDFGANAVYFALYSFLALALLLLFSWKYSFLSKTWVVIVLTIPLIVFFILLSSKSLILLFCLTIIPFYIRKIAKLKKIAGLMLGITFILFIGFVFLTNNPIQKRFHEILQNTEKTAWLPEYSNGQKQHFNNLTLRLFLWKTAIQNVQENNLWLQGCGNGDVTEMQKKKISEYGTKSELLNADPPLWQYNIHNMYFQTLLMLGMPGMLLLISILFLPFFYIKYVENKIVYILFHISIILFMIQESALQTQAGIIFYTFFSTVFYSYVYYNKKQLKSSIN